MTNDARSGAAELSAAGRCSLGCTTSCKAREHGCASECPAVPWQPSNATPPSQRVPGELKAGDRIQDNDPRVGNRVLRVVDFGSKNGISVVRCQPLNHTLKTPIKIRADRIHTDGKPRKSGFTLLKV